MKGKKVSPRRSERRSASRADVALQIESLLMKNVAPEVKLKAFAFFLYRISVYSISLFSRVSCCVHFNLLIFLRVVPPYFALPFSLFRFTAAMIFPSSVASRIHQLS